jgi:hypothetical protein
LKLKLDENLGTRCDQLLRSLGHDPCTVAAQNLQGSHDRELIARCREDERYLVTLDMDFANPFGFKPADYHGIAVLRLPPQPDFADLAVAVETLGQALLTADIRGALWIVQSHRIRVYQPDQ